MRISDWSSDVCSSDLTHLVEEAGGKHRVEARLDARMQDAAVGRCDHQFQHPARRARAGRRVGLPLADRPTAGAEHFRSEEHTSELQSLMRNSYAVYCLKKQESESSYQHP